MMNKIIRIAFKTLSLTALIFGKMSLEGGTAYTWKTTPTTANLADPGNWTPGAPPPPPKAGDTAAFGISTPNTVLNFNLPFNPDQVIFNSGSNVTLSVGGGSIWPMTVTGFTNLDNTQHFIVVNSTGTLNIAGTASGMTANSLAPLAYNINGGQVNISQTATAGGSSNVSVAGPFFTVDNTGGALNFLGSSTGGNAQITLGTTGTPSFSIDHDVSVVSISTTNPTATLLLGGGLTVNQTSPTTIAGLIQDNGTPGSLIDNGTGLLTLTNSGNSYTGGTTLNKGTISISDDSALGASSGLLTFNGAGTTLQMTGNVFSVRNVALNSPAIFDTTNTTDTFFGTFSGTGLVTKVGTGTLILLGNNTNTGGFLISAGTLQGTTNSLHGNIQDNGLLVFDQSFTGTFGGTISGTGGVTKNGSGTVILTANNTYTGPTAFLEGILAVSNDNNLGAPSSNLIFDGGTLQFLNSFTTNRNITLSPGGGTFDTLANTDTLSGAISGSGNFTKTGTGKLILTGNNTYTGNTIVDQGTLNVSSNSNLGSGDVILNGGIFQFGGNFTATDNFILNPPGGTIDTQGFTDAISGVISGAGSLTKIGTGTLTLTNSNTYSGGTNINQGVLAVSSDANLGNPNGNLSFNGGTLRFLSSFSTARNVLLNAGGGTIDTQGFFDTMSGNFTGVGSLTKIGNGVLTLTGTNSYTGGTTIAAGALVGTTNSLQGNIVNNGTLDFNQNFNGTMSGNISGTGTLIKEGTGTVTLTGINSYTGLTRLLGGTLSVSSDNNLGAPTSNLLFNGGTLQFTSNLTTARNVTLNLLGGTIDTLGNTDTMSGNFTGIGSLTKIGTGTLILTGTNSYTGGTTVSQGTLQGNSTSLQGNITNNATLVFDQPTNGTFNGTLSGNGTTIKQGVGTLTFATNSPSFTGTTFVNQGILALNAQLGGNLVAQMTGTLAGTGSVLGNLSILPGGTVAPGNNGIGTLNVGGNFIQDSGSTYAVDFNQNNSDLILINGTATLNGGEVVATSTDGSFSITKDYEILHANGGVGGTYDGVTVTNLSLQPELIYDGFNVFMSFKQPLINIAKTPNQVQVIRSLESITSPTPEQQAFLNELTSLTIPEMLAAITQLTGEHFATMYVLAEDSSERFIKMLYDPLRPMMTTDPRCRQCCSDMEIELWVEGATGQTNYFGDNFVRGVDIKNREFFGAAQVTGLYENLTLGFGGYYEHDHSSFKIGGSDKSHTFLGGIYGLYQSCSYYFLGDLVLGSSHHRIRRPIDVGDIHLAASSDPTVIQGMGYFELGRDVWLGCRGGFLSSIALQPFIGLGVGVYHSDELIERGANPVDLRLPGQTKDSAFTRVGAHITFLDLLTYFDLGIDAAWQFRLTSNHFDVTENFVGFGPEFPIQGFTRDISTFDGAINLTTHISNWDLYLQASGTIGNEVSAWTYLGGIGFKW